MLESLVCHLRAHGVRATAMAALRALARRAYLQERLIVLLKELDSVVEPRRRAELRVEDLDAGRLRDLAALNRARARPDIDRRFARYVREGFNGFVGYSGAEPVAYYWWVDEAAAGRFPDLRALGLGIEVGPGEVYGSDFFVLEDHRGGPLAADFLFQIETALRERGYQRLWGYVLSANRPARWIYSMRGYTPMWVVNRRRVLGFQRSTRESSSARRVAA